MKEYDLQKLINNPESVEGKITELMEKKLLFKQNVDKEEVEKLRIHATIFVNKIKGIIIS